MKIIHIFGELKPSGGEAMMLSAAPIWLPAAEMHILSTGDNTVGVYADKLSVAGYIIHHIPFRRSMLFFFQISRLLRNGAFDIVHIHSERASIFYALTARLTLGKKLIIIRTVHHIFKFNGWLRKRKRIERYLMRALLKVIIISNSPSGLRNEINRFNSYNILIPNWYESKFYTIPTAFERELARNKLGYNVNTCIFLSLGGNWEYKNYNMIIEALALLPDKLDLLYVQVGMQGEGRPLEALATRLSVTDKLRCMGVVDDPRLFLHAADVYIMPSSEEGFGVAAVEAMACGLPAILSNVEALCDFRDKISDIEYINPEPHAIATAMLLYYKLSDAQRRRCGSLIADAVKKNYGVEIGAYAYLRLYNESLKNT